jgi:hypothetical protein
MASKKSESIVDVYRSDDATWFTTILPMSPSKTSYRRVFDQIIHPIDREDFFQRHWERRPAVFQRSSKRNDTINVSFEQAMKEVFSLDKLVDIIDNNDIPNEEAHIKFRSYQANGHGRTPSASAKSHKEDEEEEETEMLDRETLQKIGSSTIQFPQPQRFSDELYPIVAGFEYVFGTLAGCSSYITPPHSQGLAPHYDDIEAFIIQTEGTKLWHIWQGPLELPDKPSEDIRRESLPTTMFEVLLQPGDMIYLPRGTIHEAIAQHRLSTHVTISVYQRYHIATLLTEVMTAAIESSFDEDLELRQGLPLQFNEKYGTYATAVAASGALGRAVPTDSTTCRRTEEREALFGKVKEKLLHLVTNLKQDHFDQAADKIISDFTAHRLPPPDIAESFHDFVEEQGDKRLMLSEDDSILCCDPSSFHCSIIDVNSIATLLLEHSRFLDRLSHMGHPSLQGESEEHELVSCELPVRLLPVVQTLRESYHKGAVKISFLVEQIKTSRIAVDEVSGG